MVHFFQLLNGNRLLQIRTQLKCILCIYSVQFNSTPRLLKSVSYMKRDKDHEALHPMRPMVSDFTIQCCRNKQNCVPNLSPLRHREVG